MWEWETYKAVGRLADAAEQATRQHRMQGWAQVGIVAASTTAICVYLGYDLWGRYQQNKKMKEWLVSPFFNRDNEINVVDGEDDQ